MLRFIALVTTSLLFATPVLAADPAMVVAKKDGFHFEYAKELQPGDRVRIYGRYLDINEAFSFVVEGTCGPTQKSTNRSLSLIV